MKLKWYGHSCFSLTFADGTTLITDPFDDTTGYPLCTARADAVLSSHDHFDHNHIASISGSPTMINTPGMHELNGIKITGTAAFHDPEEGKLRGKNVIFAVEAEGLKLVHLGDLGHDLDDDQIEELGKLDAVLLPIGGTYTLNCQQASDLADRLQVKTVIPMHYRRGDMGFEVLQTLQEFLILRPGYQEIPGNSLEITDDMPETTIVLNVK